MRDWRYNAEQYRDLDRAAQERAEKELGAVMNGLAESVADIPDAEVLAEAREAGEDTSAVAARVQAMIRRAAAGEMAHSTPGPWTYQEHRPAPYDGPERVLITIRDARNVCLATLDRLDYAVSAAETRANARLIALAPRMAALIRIVVAAEREIGDRMNCHVAEVRTEARAILRELDGGA